MTDSKIMQKLGETRMRYIEEILLDMGIQAKKVEVALASAAAFVQATHDLVSMSQLQQILERQTEIMEKYHRDHE
jgi:coenzyme F420-reducing hydrogenase delta subunit